MRRSLNAGLPSLCRQLKTMRAHAEQLQPIDDDNDAKRTNVYVSFEKVDVLNTPLLFREGEGVGFDLIVSNPPYICNKEREAMERNVLEHEPELALFVPDDDPLLFYRAIAHYAVKALNPSGELYFEINPLYVNEMKQMLSDEGFSHIEIRNDQFGKQRFTKSCL